jgi:two-component system cell cycle response regulator CtrA
MRILIVEDDHSASRTIEKILAASGAVSDIVGDGEEAMEYVRTYDYDIIVLDLILPDMHGSKLLQNLRNARIHTPVLVLSGDQTMEMRVKCLRAGADDYMSKPYHRDELMARLHAIARRSKSHSRSVIEMGSLEIDLDSKSVVAAGTKVNLTIKEYQMLEALTLRRGTTLSKNALLNQLYGGMDEPEQKIIDVFVCKLRKKLAAASHGENYIVTDWGRGYRLQDPALHKQAA